jgi:hypothetical protein
VWISVYKCFLQVHFYLVAPHICVFKLLIGIKVSLYFPLPSADGKPFSVATGLALMQYRLIASRCLRLPLTFCLLSFYCLISKQNIHFPSHKISYLLIMPQFNILCFCFIPRKQTINDRTLPVPHSTHYTTYKPQYTRLPYQPTAFPIPTYQTAV